MFELFFHRFKLQKQLITMKFEENTMNNEELTQAEQTIVGKQQLLVKMQLSQKANVLTAKQQLLVKAGLAKLKTADNQI
jgi:hypothetical protein